MPVMVTEIEIRLAEPADAPAISAVLHESFLEFKPLYTPGGFAATTPQPQQVLVRMREGPVWAGFGNGQIVGTVAAMERDGAAYMRGMAVVYAARGSGMADKLVEKVEEWAARHRYNRLFLTTTPFLSAAIRLYERHGFVRAVPEPPDLFGTPLFTMEKGLNLRP
jgi:GNAT superfamily N-acetyltransferase